ncbi:uncharacterized protein LOC142357166, partial [Convolutriloba macropyga]|uniref:uncharacterized protein LOC142357166 n=1 Tax=Convolutriloba macropyga TaxID=536237 RepID=UPI003F524331
SLVGLKRLQQLNISANQLISTRGLSLVSSLTTLDVSSNHITALDEIESLAVLQVLVASGNAIQEMPRLTNNVLLRHVDLGSNCISSAATLSICWLPLLRTLNLSRNSLDSLPSLKTTINLEVMDCSCNEINTAESLIESLGSLGRIRILNAKDNPLVVDKDTLSKIRSELLSLIQFNEEELRRNTVSPETKKTPQFQSVCLSQLQLLESMESAIKLLHPVNGTENTAVLEYIATKTALLDLHFEMSVKLREEHEYGETHVAQTFVSVDSLINQNRVKVNALPDIGAEEKQEKYVRPPSRPKSSAKARSKTGEGSNSARRSDENRESSRRIQEIKVPSVPNETVEFVRNAWKSAVKDSNEQAASRIQAIWRGFWVRKKLSSIQAQVDEEIRQMMMEEDLELDEEIDLEQFNYLETEFSLDDWTIDQDPAAPEGQDVKTASNRRDSSRNSKWIDSSSIASQPLPTVLETEREKLKASISIDLARAEECVEQRTGEGLIDVRMRYHGSTMSGNEVAANDDAVSKIDLYDEIEEEENANSFSARQTKIAQDWGFKNSATAELMLKRAKKMSKVKKQIGKVLLPPVTDIPQHSRMQTKGSHSSVLSNNNSSSVNSRRSSRLPNGSESMTSSRRSQHTNVLQQKVFEAGDFNTNAPSTDNYSRVFAWVNLGGSENGPERDGVHGTVVTGTTREHPSHSNRDSPLLRTGSPKPMGNPITPTAKRNSLPNAKQNVLYNDRDGGDMDILSVSDTRSQRSSQRGNRQQRSAGSPESKRTNNSSAISSFLNKTKVLPPINGKHVDRGSERTSSGGWGAGKKHSGKPPKPTRTYAK